ncbi:hypothetical protein ACFL37_00400 [Candidatus Margulisiibacteriota bacterium]
MKTLCKYLAKATAASLFVQVQNRSVSGSGASGGFFQELGLLPLGFFPALIF